MSAIAGTVSLTIDGATYAVAAQCEYLVNSTNRETLKGQDGVHGFKETPNEGYISFQGRDTGAVSMKTLNDAQNATVVATLVNGKVIIASNAWRDGEPAAVNTEDGTFNAKFSSAKVTEN
jgi:hypothetical protein